MEKEKYRRIPLTLITGFLGGGKSTFINKILKEKNDTRFGLVLNEFGDVQLESQIVHTHQDDVVELSNGCMCCVAREDIFKSVTDLITQKPELDHIIIEASGLSDPAPIANVLMALPFSRALKIKLHLDTIICIVDPINFFARKEEYVILVQQLEFASFVLLSKTDLANKEQITRVKEEVRKINPQATIMTTHDDLDSLLDNSPVDHTSAQQLEEEYSCGQEHNHNHKHDNCGHDHDSHGQHKYAHEDVNILFFKTTNPLNYQRFKKVMTELPENIIRVKGFGYFSGEYAQAKIILQCVGSRQDGMINEWQEDEEKQSAMVFIGKGFDKKKLEEQLKACEEK